MNINDERGKKLLRQRQRLCSHCKVPIEWHISRSNQSHSSSITCDHYYDYRISIGGDTACMMAISKFFNYSCYYRWLITTFDIQSLLRIAGFERNLIYRNQILAYRDRFMPSNVREILSPLYWGSIMNGKVEGKFTSFTVSQAIYNKWRQNQFKCYLTEFPIEIIESIFTYIGCHVEMIASEVVLEDADAGILVEMQPSVNYYAEIKVVLNMNTLIKGILQGMQIKKFMPCFKSVKLTGKEWHDRFAGSISLANNGEYRGSQGYYRVIDEFSINMQY